MSSPSWPTHSIGLAPRRPGVRCDRKAALVLLESERTIALALAVRAIAEGWDSGRLGTMESEHPREREVLGLLGIRQGLATSRVAEATEALDEVMATARKVEATIEGRFYFNELSRLGLAFEG